MNVVGPLLVVILGLVVLYAGCGTLLRRLREARIERYAFPPALGAKVRATYPHLAQHEVEQVLEALRDYFVICNRAGRRMVAMPSRAVDVAWHEFILFTRAYQHFCRRALGGFLHHTPATAMRAPTVAEAGIKRAWRLACWRAGIDRTRPSALPPLFALDAALAIPDGFVYRLDCLAAGTAPQGYCASHIGCAGGCSGGGDGHGDGAGDGGCGGGGCGGD
ncbi:MAG: hypothetical protein RLW62_07630 [Gammaproteobacteria bacterium]